MNNERKLYNLIKENNNFLAMRDTEVAKLLGVSRYTIPNYKKRLIDKGYIETKVRVEDNRPMTLYKIIKEYDGSVQW